MPASRTRTCRLVTAGAAISLAAAAALAPASSASGHSLAGAAPQSSTAPAASAPRFVYVTDPVVNDPAGTAADGVIVTHTDNVTWSVDGKAVDFAGSRSILIPLAEGRNAGGNRTVEVSAVAAPGYRHYPENHSRRSYTIKVTSGRPEPGKIRLGGANRFETAVQISKKYFPGTTQAVFVANGSSFADALAAGPAAARANSPLLLSDTTLVPGEVVDELKRLSPTTIYMVGGRGVLDGSAAMTLGQVAPVKRLAGVNRFDTAAAVAQTWRSSETVYLASGLDFPDAVSGGSGAAKQGAPLLLSDGRTLTDATVVELRRLKPKKVVLVGGEAVLPASLARKVGDLLPGVDIERVGGKDRFETSALIMRNVTATENQSTVFLATGLNYPDALAGIPAAHSVNAPLALTAPYCLSRSIKDVLDTMPLDTTIRLGAWLVMGEFSVLREDHAC